MAKKKRMWGEVILDGNPVCKSLEGEGCSVSEAEGVARSRAVPEGLLLKHRLTLMMMEIICKVDPEGEERVSEQSGSFWGCPLK